MSPEECHLWTKPNLQSEDLHASNFDEIKTLLDDDHYKKKILKCKDCGQLYHYEMREQVDWISGNDPQFRRYTPIASENETLGRPVLKSDWPSDQEKPKIYWER